MKGARHGTIATTGLEGVAAAVGGEWTQLQQLTGPTSGAFTFSGLDFSSYQRVEVWLQGIRSATNSIKVQARFRYAGPTTFNHNWGIRNRTQADGSTSDASASSAGEGQLVGNAGSTYSLGNGAADTLSGVLSIHSPGSSSLQKIADWHGGHWNSGSPEILFVHSIIKTTETNPITGIVILGSAALTDGVVTLVGMVN